MKNNLVKRLALVAVAAVMTFSVVACGNKEVTTTTPDVVEEEAVVEEPVVEEPVVEETPEVSADALTEEEYIAKVTELGNAMVTISTESQTKLAELDPTDVEGATALIEDMKAPFVEFAAVLAPEAYVAAQDQFKIACEGMVAYLDMTVELMVASEAGEDVTELTAKLTEAATKVQTDFASAAALMPAVATEEVTTDAATEEVTTDAATEEVTEEVTEEKTTKN